MNSMITDMVSPTLLPTGGFLIELRTSHLPPREKLMPEELLRPFLTHAFVSSLQDLTLHFQYFMRQRSP
jgi:hypothetical protein